ncbi:MAG TPA: TetR/AcrR family transcriptional regulator [Acidimicrobiia bacterium]
MTVETDAVAGRRPGRPRSTTADQAILDAALELFAELGYEGLSVEAVAGRAEVSKATIYRRYPSKSDLVIAACTAVSDQVREPADTGSLRGDVEVIVGNICRMLTTTVNGRLLPQMVAEAARNPEFKAAKEEFVARRRRVCLEALGRAADRGEISSAVDVESFADLVTAPLFYRHLVSGGSLGSAFQRAHVDTVVRALTA